MPTKRPYLSVVIPAFQEEHRITDTLKSVIGFLSTQRFSSEILIVDDGSSDATSRVAETALGHAIPFRILKHPVNKGKGAAVRTGMMAARGTFALFADADNATPIGELPKLLDAAQHGWDVVMGSRYVTGGRIAKKQPLFRRFMSRAGNLLFRIVLGLDYADTRCGFKLFNERARSIVFPRQRLERWGFDTEILVIAREHGLKVCEVPVTWYDRERGNIHPLKDSIRSLKEIGLIMIARSRRQYR